MKSTTNKLFSLIKVLPLLSFLLMCILLQPVKAQVTSPDNQAKLQQFEDAITKGEQFLQAKEYAKAKAEYQKALIIDPSSKYPKDKLTYIRKFYIDPADEVRFNTAMESGNKLMIEADYAAAQAQFEIASNIKPEDKTARDKMAEAEKLNLAKLEKQKQYNKLVADADRLFVAKEMTAARAAYDAALKVDPTASYPQQRIGEIDAKAASEKAQNDAYNKALTDGDEAYMNRDFTTARLKYEQALKIKPGENYPKSMLERVAQGTEQLKDALQNYQTAIAGADKLFDKKDYETALPAYQNAQKIMPSEKYPSQQIEKIEAILLQMQKLEEDYTKAIAAGDRLLNEKQYADAKIEYQNANNLKPDESYPKQKIEEVAGLLLALKEAERNKKYLSVVTEADQLFDSKDFNTALQKYQEATTIKPEENHPKEKIAAINKLKSEEQANEKGYEKAIADADRKFAVKAYEESVVLYQSALSLKPTESYPAEQISRAQAAIAALKQQEEAYNLAIASGDNLMNKGENESAIQNYQQALTIKPDSKYPQDQIIKINAIINANKSKEERYQKLIADGDRLFGATSYPDALSAYNQAISLKPDEKYPVAQVSKINLLIEEQKAKQTAYNQQIADADKLYNENDLEKALKKYKEALLTIPAEKYPQDRISAINSILEQRKSLEENYAKNISEGDKAYKDKELEVALAAYEKAKALKPSEKYPQDQLALIEKSLAASKAAEENYQRIIGDADRAFNNSEMEIATAKYNEAGKLKPDESYPKQQIEKIKDLLANQKEIYENYRLAIVEADRLFNAKDYDPALIKYNEALSLKPNEIWPGEQISKINALKGQMAEAEQAYADALANADNLFDSSKWDEAIAAYQQALKLKPNEQKPKDRITQIEIKKSELRSVNENYSGLIAEADRLFDAKEYANSIQAYEKALALKSSETYPKARISAINSILDDQKQLADKDYNDAIENANRMFTQKDYISAIKAYESASSIRPAEAYPKNKLIEIKNILMERSRNQMDAYNKIISKADLAYQDKIFDQAIDGYEEAKLAKPDEVYPDEMIRKIRKYMEEHTMVDLISAPLVVSADTEKKFNFKPIEMRLRKNNYIILKARKTSEIEPKVYLNYGIDGQKSGGIVLRSIKSQETGDYMVRVSIQDRWYRLDNNWVSIYSEGGEVEISKMQISQGD